WVDESVDSIGPEDGTTYQVDCYINGALDQSEAGLTSTSTTWTPSANGIARVELWSVRELLDSRQKHVHEFMVGSALPWTPASMAVPAEIWANDSSSVTDAGGGACSQWNDLSGNNYHFTQSTSSQRPIISAGALNG